MLRGVGGRFRVRPRGLVIHNVTESDNGDYTCRAEVEAEGRYDERRISLVVHSVYSVAVLLLLVRKYTAILQ